VLYSADFEDADNVVACTNFFTPNGGAINAQHTALINNARDGTLRALMFNANEIRLGALLGIWSPADVPAGGALHIQILQDLEFVSRVVNNQGGGVGRANYATATLPQDLINTNMLYHLIALLLVKLYFAAKFPSFNDPPFGAAEVTALVNALNVGITTVGSHASALASAAAALAAAAGAGGLPGGYVPPAIVNHNHLTLITANPTVHEVLARVFETWHDSDMSAACPA
jgi:hypothetical protein